jgi:hypothetical protein
MLYWICPECGGECSPAVRECPACAGPPAISPASANPAHRKPEVTEEVLALVQSLQPGVHTHAVANTMAGENGHSAKTTTLELPEAAVEEEAPSAPPKEAIESLVRPLIESTRLTPAPAGPERTPEPLAPLLLSKAMELQAELVLDSMTQPNIAEQTAIRGIVASFQQQPQTSLLTPATQVAANSQTAHLTCAPHGPESQGAAFGTSDAAFGRSMRSAGVTESDGAARRASRPTAKEGRSSSMDRKLPGGAHAIPGRGKSPPILVRQSRCKNCCCRITAPRSIHLSHPHWRAAGIEARGSDRSAHRTRLEP